MWVLKYSITKGNEILHEEIEETIRVIDAITMKKNIEGLHAIKNKHEIDCNIRTIFLKGLAKITAH